MKPAILGFLGAAVLLTACGGGGSGSSTAAPPPNPLYVSATTGSDTNLGDQAHPLKSVLKAAQLALDGYKIIVAPGTYPGGITTAAVGTPPQGLQFLADTSGTQTGSPAGPVVVDGTGLEAGFKLVNSDGTLIDGFTVIGGTGGNFGIVIKSGSDNFVVRNCIVHDNGDDGIRVQDSSNVLIFNNLIYNNGGDGISMVGSISGSPKGQVINNTIVNNTGHGITFGSSTTASPDGFVRNNIVENGGPADNIKVFTSSKARSDVGYLEDFDLVFPFTFDTGNPTIKGSNDINGDARFADVSQNDFHLMADSPAIDAGDPGLDATLAGQLATRTTTGMTLDSETKKCANSGPNFDQICTADSDCDSASNAGDGRCRLAVVDLGFHYAMPGAP